MLDTSKIPTKRVDGYYTHITNCITKIPQNIKLELVDGTLILKAGSKVYVPNGVGVFNEVVISRDITIQGFSNFKGAVVINADGGGYAFTSLDQCYSGTLQPVLANGVLWYDTSSNIVKRCNDGQTFIGPYSLPICIITSSGSSQQISTVASIDQVFNGFGFIGSTIFVLPGVEGIIPNGFNEDGSIRNIHCQIEEVQTKQTLNGWNNHWYVHLMGENLIEYHPWELYYNQVDKPMSVGQTAYWYNPNEKIVQSTDDFGTTWNTTRQVTPFLEVFQNGETITSIKPINVYENITSKTVENKFKVVSELPSFPEVGVFYFVKE